MIANSIKSSLNFSQPLSIHLQHVCGVLDTAPHRIRLPGTMSAISLRFPTDWHVRPLKPQRASAARRPSLHKRRSPADTSAPAARRSRTIPRLAIRNYTRVSPSHPPASDPLARDRARRCIVGSRGAGPRPSPRAVTRAERQRRARRLGRDR